MAEFEELEISSGHLGLVTNPSAVDADKQSFRTFQNVDVVRPGLFIPFAGFGTAQIRVEGVLTTVPALPSGFTLEKGFVWHSTAPETGSDYIIIFGSKNSRDRFYVWPDITLNRTWSTTTGSKVSGSYINWLELTEAVSTTITSVNSTGVTGDNFVVASVSDLDTSLNNYYATFYIMVFNGSTNAYRGGSIVDNWTAASRTMDTNFGITGITTSDYVVITRFPIFKALATPISGGVATINSHYSIDALPVFVPHGDALIVHTGTHDINSGPDLRLGYIGDTRFGGVGANAFVGWYFDHAQPWEILKSKTVNSLTTPAESDDPIPEATYYVIHHTLVYDGIQESNIYFDATNTFTGNHAVANVGGGRAFANTVSLNFGADFDRTSPYSTGTNFNSFLSRRATAIRVYMAQADAVTGSSAFKPTTPLFFVKEISFISGLGTWTQDGGTGEYETDYTLYGRDWFEGQKYPFSLINGYETSKVGANADFGVSVAGRSFAAPIFDDTEKLYRSLFSPIRLSGENGPEVFPVISRVDTLHHGIYEITGLAEQFGRLLVFGRNQVVIAGVSGANKGEIDEAYQKVGCVAHRTIKNLEGLVFFLSERYVEVFDGNKITESPFERIRDIFDALTQTQKEACFAGVHRVRREYWIHISDGSSKGRTFIYSLPFDMIKEYVPSSAVLIDLIETVDGGLIGLTSSSIAELASGSPTESLAITIKSQVFNHNRGNYRRLRMAYESPSTLIAYPIDETQVSALQELDPIIFLAQTEIEEIDEPTGLDSDRASFKITRAASTDLTLQIDSITLARKPKRNL